MNLHLASLQVLVGALAKPLAHHLACLWHAIWDNWVSSDRFRRYRKKFASGGTRTLLQHALRGVVHTNELLEAHYGEHAMFRTRHPPRCHLDDSLAVFAKPASWTFATLEGREVVTLMFSAPGRK